VDHGHRMALLHYYAYHQDHPYLARLAQQKLREFFEIHDQGAVLTAITFNPEDEDRGQVDEHRSRLRRVTPCARREC
jgi:hypothetical protein